MSSEWIKLTSQADGKIKNGTEIYINLANASSIYPQGGGSEIWFLAGAGPEGHVRVMECPETIFRRLQEVIDNPQARWANGKTSQRA
jgi:hypothetical protein